MHTNPVELTKIVQKVPSESDPSFDFHLLNSTNCVDAGAFVELNRDRDGKLRPVGAGIDIGPYEFGSLMAAPDFDNGYIWLPDLPPPNAPPANNPSGKTNTPRPSASFLLFKNVLYMNEGDPMDIKLMVDVAGPISLVVIDRLGQRGQTHSG